MSMRNVDGKAVIQYWGNDTILKSVYSTKKQEFDVESKHYCVRSSRLIFKKEVYQCISYGSNKGLKRTIFKLQLGISVSESSYLKEIKPVPIYKHCAPPCDGNTPCIRICKSCPGISQYPNLSENLQFWDNKRACSTVSKEALDTLFATGR